MTGPNPEQGERKQIMNKSEIKLVAALHNIKVGRGILTIGSALLLSHKLQQSTVEEFAEWLSANADKLRMRIIHEHTLDSAEIDDAVDGVAKRLLELDSELTDNEEGD